MIKLGNGLAQQFQAAILGIEHNHAAIRSIQARAHISYGVNSDVHVHDLQSHLGGGKRRDLL
jgi:hypothetical protein